MSQLYLISKNVDENKRALFIESPELLALSMKSFEYLEELKRTGHLIGAWSFVGETSGIWIVQVENHAELDDIMMNLPMYPFVTLKATPINPHEDRHQGLKMMIHDKFNNEGIVQQLCNSFWETQGIKAQPSNLAKSLGLEPAQNFNSKEGPGWRALKAIENSTKDQD